jgi:hypothetical protein
LIQEGLLSTTQMQRKLVGVALHLPPNFYRTEVADQRTIALLKAKEA